MGTGSSQVVVVVNLSNSTAPLLTEPLSTPATIGATVDMSALGTIDATDKERGDHFDAPQDDTA